MLRPQNNARINPLSIVGRLKIPAAWRYNFARQRIPWRRGKQG